MAEPIYILIWTLAIAVFVLSCIPKVSTLPIYAISTMLSTGGIACAIEGFSEGVLSDSASYTLAVTMTIILIYSTFHTIMEITPTMERGRWRPRRSTPAI